MASDIYFKKMDPGPERFRIRSGSNSKHNNFEGTDNETNNYLRQISTNMYRTTYREDFSKYLGNSTRYFSKKCQKSANHFWRNFFIFFQSKEQKSVKISVVPNFKLFYRLKLNAVKLYCSVKRIIFYINGGELTLSSPLALGMQV